jgi:hypothetical protein
MCLYYRFSGPRMAVDFQRWHIQRSRTAGVQSTWLMCLCNKFSGPRITVGFQRWHTTTSHCQCLVNHTWCVCVSSTHLIIFKRFLTVLCPHLDWLSIQLYCIAPLFAIPIYSDALNWHYDKFCISIWFLYDDGHGTYIIHPTFSSIASLTLKIGNLGINIPN